MFYFIHEVCLRCGTALFVLQQAATDHVYHGLLCYVTDMVSGIQEYRPLVASLSYYSDPPLRCFDSEDTLPPPPAFVCPARAWDASLMNVISLLMFPDLSCF